MKTTYQNPIAAGGDFADPFVMRYNGRYYLYCTNPDIRCWSSDNLLEWKAEGPTIGTDTFPDLVPFAPEVVYSNGKFYMYTSPSGFGHYILESEHPTGPFSKVSDNVLHAIDGSVFIDDDGTWYFYWAGDEGIWGCKMESPTEFGEPVFTGVTLHGWTEGPFIYKQNGYYYMTYTGNHYLSKGYRINAAWSTHPLTGYQDEVYNPVIIHTQGEVVGLGHSSTVLGPDLVSYYIVYHNMNEDLSRDLDIDRQLWYEKATQILGPTRLPQPAPAYPDYAFPGRAKEALTWQFYEGYWEEREDIYYSSNQGLFVLADQRLQTSFTAEFHLLIPITSEANVCGLVIGEDREEYYSLAFDRLTNCLQLWSCRKNDNRCLRKATLPPDYVFDALHCIRVEYDKKGKVTVYIDNRLQMKEDKIHLDFARIGYFSEPGQIGCGYTAVTGTTCEAASEQVAIPMNCGFYPVFGSGTFERNSDGSIIIKEGCQAQYQLNVDCSGQYILQVITKDSRAFSEADIRIDDLGVDVRTDSSGVQTCQVWLSAGRHVMKITPSNEVLVIRRIYFKSVEEEKETNKLYPPLRVGLYGKELLEGTYGMDYTVSAWLSSEFMGEDSNAGILVRVTEPSEGGEGADPILGIHFFIGYSVSFTGRDLVIARHRYDKEILAACAFEFEVNKTYELKVTVSGDEILAYINQEEVPRLSVRDRDVITGGSVGIWAENSLITVENIHFKKTETATFK
jgi:xylan 1,4-beta-xylosidase